jgi:methylglyoxal synthase
MKVKIYYVEVAPELESKEFDLASVIKSKGECIVGRSPECDLILEGSDLSRQHGKFWVENDYYYFADLGSSNGSLFNGELVDRNQKYLLNIGDTIRVGDFVLKMEPAEEIAATVMKVLDPALFKPRPPVIVDASQPEPQISPIVPAIGLAAAAISMPMIVDRSEQKQPDLEIENPLPPELINDEWSNDNTSDYLQHSTLEQAVADPLVIEDEDQIEQPDPVIPVRPLSALVLDDEDDELEELPDSVVASQLPSTLAIDEEDAELSNPVIETQPPSTLMFDDEDESTEDLLDSSTLMETAPTLVVNDEEEPELINSIIIEQPAEILVVEDEDEDEDEVAVPDIEIAVFPATTLEIEDGDAEELPDLFATSEPLPGWVEAEAEEDEDLPNLLVTEQLPDDVVAWEIEETETLEQDQNLQVEPTSSLPVAVAIVAVADEISVQHKKFGAELLSQKQIVLIAHDEKVADLIDLVNQHKDFLATCLTISWASIAGTLRQETGMSVSKELPSGVSGGFQTLAGLVNSGDVLAVIFLKDFFTQASTGQANEEALLRLCNINEILLATNIATAESIVHYLQS